MPKTYTITFTERELKYILETLESDQEDLVHQGASYDFLNRLMDKLDIILYNKEA